MKKWNKRAGHFLSALLLFLVCVLSTLFGGCTLDEVSRGETDWVSVTEAESMPGSQESVVSKSSDGTKEQEAAKKNLVRESGTYTSPDEVALYLHLYEHLPSNYITKREAEEAGWESSKGNLWDVADGMSIGGSRFGNYEGLLPDAQGRKWYECDVNYEGGYRGAERLLYSNDGLIYYTKDHYKTFTKLYENNCQTQ